MSPTPVAASQEPPGLGCAMVGLGCRGMAELLQPLLPRSLYFATVNPSLSQETRSMSYDG